MSDDTKALLALCDKLLSNPNGYNESSLTIAAWAKEQLLSSASGPTEGEIAEIRKRHDDVETLRHASMSQVGGMEHWVISFGMRAHFDRATLLRLLESRTAGERPCNVTLNKITLSALLLGYMRSVDFSCVADKAAEAVIQHIEAKSDA